MGSSDVSFLEALSLFLFFRECGMPTYILGSMFYLRRTEDWKIIATSKISAIIDWLNKLIHCFNYGNPTVTILSS